jgi:hypothetical protein
VGRFDSSLERSQTPDVTSRLAQVNLIPMFTGFLWSVGLPSAILTAATFTLFTPQPIPSFLRQNIL